MPLDENGRYVSVAKHRVNMRGTIEDGIVCSGFSYQIMKILDMTIEEYYDNIDRVEKENHILSGLTSDFTMPGGYWHQETGKCLGGNTGGVVGNGEKYENFIRGFDIKIDE
ncbi:MAG: hypothetical protein Q8K26_05415 [Candidatus Gracilibacteria bacterium]|nr:hypothetical protein [Candidatus Gracilibacteria bacterium]